MQHKIKLNSSKGATGFVLGFYVVVTALLSLWYNREVGFGTKLIFDVLLISGFIIFLIAIGALIIYINRFVILTSEGATMKSLLTVVGAFTWQEVVSAEISERISAPDSEGKKRVTRNIIITTESAGENPYKLKSPYNIIYSPENQKLLLMYLEKYTTGVDLTTFRTVYPK